MYAYMFVYCISSRLLSLSPLSSYTCEQIPSVCIYIYTQPCEDGFLLGRVPHQVVVLSSLDYGTLRPLGGSTVWIHPSMSGVRRRVAAMKFIKVRATIASA